MPRKVNRSKTQPAYHHGDLRRSLLDTALALVASEGIPALSLREVARRAGVSHAAPYNHFEDKAALLSAVAEEGFREMQETMEQAAVDAGPNPLEQLRSVGVAYVRFAAQHPAHFRVMFSPEVAGGRASPALQEAARTTFSRLLAGLGQARGVAPEAALDGAITAWATMHGLALLWIDDQLNWVAPSGDQSTGDQPARDPAEALALRVTRVLGGALASRG